MSPLPLPEQELARISLTDDRDAPLKPSLYSKSSPLGSLNRLMCGPATITAARSALVRTVETQQTELNTRPAKRVCFNVEDYEYNVALRPEAPRPIRKRRYERRNSKTPAMLMAVSAALDIEFLREHDEKDNDPSENHSWDDGLEIAEELVKQLHRNRRQSNS